MNKAEALKRILGAIEDKDMSAQNKLGLIEYLAQDALGILMKNRCKVCFQVIDAGEYCDAHCPG